LAIDALINPTILRQFGGNTWTARAESRRAFRQEIKEWRAIETNPYPDGDDGQPRAKKEDVDRVPLHRHIIGWAGADEGEAAHRRAGYLT
jgi:hypothetical protein